MVAEVRTGCHVPARGKDEKVGQWRGGIPRLGSQDAEDGGINVVDRDGANIDELCQVVFERDLARVSGNLVSTGW